MSSLVAAAVVYCLRWHEAESVCIELPEITVLGCAVGPPGCQDLLPDALVL
jgi:hypothetical protein